MPKRVSPSASEYINDNFKPSDRIAVLVLNRSLRETTQRITTAQKAASPEFQAWLRYKNANGADIYVGMNPLKQDASTRTKDDIETIRHLYIDLDHGGSTALDAIKNSDLVPQPNYVLNTSPDKFQVVWKVEGITPEEAEALQHGMVREFGGDPAATDSTRVLRLPGFANKKYDQDFYVQARFESTQTYHHRDFKVPVDSQEAPRHHNEETSAQPSRSQCHAEPIGARLGLCQTRRGSRRRTRRNNSKDCRLSRRRQARPRILRASHGRQGASGVRTEDRAYLRKWTGTIRRKREEPLIRIATW